MNNIEELRKTLQGAPKGATHIDFDGIYLKYDLNKELRLYHVNYKEWQWASRYICPDQSLADIKAIIELTDKVAMLQTNTNPALRTLLYCCGGLSSDYANENYGDAILWLRHIDTAYQDYQDKEDEL